MAGSGIVTCVLAAMAAVGAAPASTAPIIPAPMITDAAMYVLRANFFIYNHPFTIEWTCVSPSRTRRKALPSHHHLQAKSERFREFQKALSLGAFKMATTIALVTHFITNVS
jgi:hypothetical protein